MEINERKVKILGVVNIPEELEHGKTYHIAIENAEMRGVTEEPNDDGTIDRIFKLKISEMSKVNLLSEKGLIQGKRKGSSSQELRRCILQYYDEQLSGGGEYLDGEAFYQKEMSKLISYWVVRLTNL